MDTLTIARALHVIAIVHWIGGVSFVTLAAALLGAHGGLW